MASERSHLQIGALPEEVLIKIFEYLCFTDRQNIRSVCKHWNELLSLSKFTKNEVLILRYEYDPMFDLIPSKLIKWDIVTESRPFLKIKLTMCHDIFDKFQFYCSIGQETKVLEINFIDVYWAKADFVKFFECFPKLETFITDSLQELLQHCPKFPRKTLKHVHVPYISHWWDRKTIPLLREMEKVTADVVFMRSPMDLVSLRISGQVDDESPIFGFEEAFDSFLGQEGWPSLNLGDFNFAKNQTIKLSDVRAFSSIKTSNLLPNLEKFVCLEKLTSISLDGNEKCPFVHNGLNLPLVRDVYVGTIECQKCLKALVASFPKADKWHFNNLNSKILDSVREIFGNVKELNVGCSSFFQVIKELNCDGEHIFQKLETLDIKNFTFELEEECDWPPMPRLRNLTLGNWHTELLLNKTIIARIVSATPEIHRFTCLSANIDEEDIRTMAEGWPYLKFLSIRVLNFSEVEAKTICKNLKDVIEDDFEEEMYDSYGFDSE